MGAFQATLEDERKRLLASALPASVGPPAPTPPVTAAPTAPPQAQPSAAGASFYSALQQESQGLGGGGTLQPTGVPAEQAAPFVPPGVSAARLERLQIPGAMPTTQGLAVEAPESMPAKIGRVLQESLQRAALPSRALAEMAGPEPAPPGQTIARAAPSATPGRVGAQAGSFAMGLLEFPVTFPIELAASISKMFDPATEAQGRAETIQYLEGFYDIPKTATDIVMDNPAFMERLREDPAATIGNLVMTALPALKARPMAGVEMLRPSPAPPSPRAPLPAERPPLEVRRTPLAAPEALPTAAREIEHPPVSVQPEQLVQLEIEGKKATVQPGRLTTMADGRPAAFVQFDDMSLGKVPVTPESAAARQPVERAAEVPSLTERFAEKPTEAPPAPTVEAAPAPPAAAEPAGWKFAGWQQRAKGKAPLDLWTLPEDAPLPSGVGGRRGQTGDTLRAAGVNLPEPPEPPPQVPPAKPTETPVLIGTPPSEPGARPAPGAAKAAPVRVKKAAVPAAGLLAPGGEEAARAAMRGRMAKGEIERGADKLAAKGLQLPEYPREKPGLVARYIRANGGLWDEANRGETIKAKENYSGVIGLRKKTGLSFDQWAERLHEDRPDVWKSREEAFDWLRNEWAEGGRKAAAPVAPVQDPRHIESQAGKFGLDVKGEEVAARPTESISETDLETGEVVYLPKDKDVYRVKQGAGGVELQDGRNIPLKFGETVEGVRLGKGTAEPALPGMEKPAAAAAEFEREVAAPKREAELVASAEERKLAEAKAAEVEQAEAATQQRLFPEGGQQRLFTTEEEAKSARERIKKKGPTLYSGIDPSKAGELVDLAKWVAEGIARGSRAGRAEFTKWAAAMREELGGLGNVRMTRDQYEKLWGVDLVRHAAHLSRGRLKEGPWIPPRPQGKLRVFQRERGALGGVAFDVWRRGEERRNLGLRLISEDGKKMFKRLDRTARESMTATLAGVSPSPKTGGPQYGALLRAGTERAYASRGKRVLPKPGTLLPDGRFIGPDRADGTAQLYRVVWPEEAKKRHEDLKAKHPEAEKILREILSQQEAPVVTVMGDELPARSRRVMKERFKIEGLTDEEALDAQAFAAKAYGGGLPEEAGNTIPNAFSWVPESAVSDRKFSGRIRNAFRAKVASTRRYKSGAIAEAVRKGQASIDIEKGITRTRQGLHMQAVQDDVVRDLLSVLAEPVTAADRAGASSHPGGLAGHLAESGYRVLSSTGLFGESEAFRRFVLRNREFMEGHGLEVPDIVDATYLAGGKAKKVPTKLMEMLAPAFELPKLSTNPEFNAFWKSMDSVAGNIIGGINVWRLSPMSVANRNILGNEIQLAARGLRDFYEEALTLVAGGAGDAPFARTAADIRALGTALTPSVRKRIPPEMLGTTWLDEAEQTGGIARLGGAWLRYLTAYNVRDVYTKRVIKEAVVDAVARQSWAAAKRLGQTGGKTKAQFVKDWKAAVPPEVESLAYREMDTWGMDYRNVHPGIEKLKQSKIGRAVVPYPTYFYKLFNMYWEMAHPENVLRVMGVGRPTRKQWVRAASNLMAFSTMSALAWRIMKPDGDLPEGLSEQDLPLELQKYGRVKVQVPWDDDEKNGYWVRLMDMPFLGEAAASRAIWGGEMNFGDFINDRLALGPLFNVVALHAGLVSRYNKDMPPGSAMGREVAGWFPFHSEMGLIRKLTDPLKRKGYDKEDNSYWRNFGRGFAEQYPILSSLLEPRVSVVRIKAATYRPWEAMSSYFILNIHAINEEERQAALALAESSKLDDQIDRLRDEQIEKYVLQTMDSEGWTLAGEIKTRGKLTALEQGQLRELKIAQAQVLIAFRDGGYEGALKRAKEIVEPHRGDPVWRKHGESLERLLDRLAKRQKYGVAYEQLEKVPRPLQLEYAPRVKKEMEAAK